MNPWDDDADGNEPQTQHQERNPLRDVVKSLETKLAEREKQFEQLASSMRQRDVGEILGEFGADKRVVKFVPATVDANPEAVKAWWEENKDVFAGAGAGAVETPSAGNVPEEPQGAPAVDQETQDRWERISRLSQSPGVAEPDRAAAAEAMLQGAKAASTNALGHVDPNAFKEFLQGTRSIPS